MLKTKGLGKLLMLGAMVAVVNVFVTPRIPLAGIGLSVALIVGGLVVNKFLGKKFPVGAAMVIAGAISLFAGVVSGLGGSMQNIAAPQALTQKQRADPVARSFL